MRINHRKIISSFNKKKSFSTSENKKTREKREKFQKTLNQISDDSDEDEVLLVERSLYELIELIVTDVYFKVFEGKDESVLKKCEQRIKKEIAKKRENKRAFLHKILKLLLVVIHKKTKVLC